jgi:transposase
LSFKVNAITDAVAFNFQNLCSTISAIDYIKNIPEVNNMEFHKKDYDYVGVDLHKNNHVAVLIDCFGDKIKTFKIKNVQSEFPKFLQDVYKASTTGKVVFGLEDTNFYGRSLAKFLLSQKQLVKEVNASFTKAMRTASLDKTDEIDALYVAQNLINHFKRLPDANPQDIYLAIQQTLNTRNQLDKAANGFKISLHNVLIHHYPNYKKFFKNFESKTARGFFKEFPSPDMLNDFKEKDLTKVLKKYNNSVSKTKSSEILNAVKEYGKYIPSVFVDDENQNICELLKTIESLLEQVKKHEETLDKLIEVSGYPLKSMPGVDTVLAATFIANIGDINRFKNSNKLANIAGIAPNSHSSGETKRHYANKLGNRELNTAFYNLALSQIRNTVNPIMHEYYQQKIKEGRKKKQAMVYVARRLVNIVFRIMKDKNEYIQPEIKKPEEIAS